MKKLVFRVSIIAAAKNFLFFIQRAKLKGSEAVLFSDVCNKVMEAIKKR